MLPAAVISGAATFLVGGVSVRLVVVVHGLAGLSLVVLAPAKSRIARRGLRRRRPGWSRSVILAAAVVIALASGVAHSTGLLVSAGAVTAIQVHVGAGLVAGLMVLLHVRDRPTRPRTADLSRRSLLRAALLTAGAGAWYGGLAATTSALSLPGARRRATGSYELASAEPDRMPVTSWLFDAAPEVDPDGWRLTVASAGTQRRWSVDQIRSMGDRATVVLDCTGGWWSRQEWSGARLSRLLPAGATGSVVVVSRTGYHRRLPLTDDLLLAVDVGGSPLSVGHGAPARLVVTGRRGYHWVKWVDRIEHDSLPWWVQLPLPAR